jgi:nitrite reductase/ring-hydroxylating ferredoxin subunit
MHKKTFSLLTGKGLSDSQYQIATFPVEVRDDEIWVKLPAAQAMDASGDCSGGCS